MTAAAIAICILCQFLLVIGQLFLKHAMSDVERSPRPWSRIAPHLAAGVGLLTLWFFLWLGLLQTWELSKLFPFEGLNPPLLVLGAWLLLKERVSLSGWIGIALIGAGVALVSTS